MVSLIEQFFENIKYGSYPINSYSNDLHIDYENSLSTEQPIDNLTNNIHEVLNVSFIKLLLDNRIYESNPRNANFYDLPFEGDERLIARRKINCINDNTIFRLINGSSVYI